MNNRIAGFFDEPWDNLGPIPPPPSERAAGRRAGVAWAKLQPVERLKDVDDQLAATEESWEYIMEDESYLESIRGTFLDRDIDLIDPPTMPAERFHYLLTAAPPIELPLWSRAICREFWGQHGPDGGLPANEYLLGFAFGMNDVASLLGRPLFNRADLPEFHWYAALLRYMDSPEVLTSIIDRMPQDTRDAIKRTIIDTYHSAETEIRTRPDLIPGWADLFLKDEIGNAFAKIGGWPYRFEGRLIVR